MAIRVKRANRHYKLLFDGVQRAGLLEPCRHAQSAGGSGKHVSVLTGSDQAPRRMPWWATPVAAVDR